MNLLGKIFTGLIAGMALVFMTMALMVYATHTNWKEAINNPSTGWSKKLADQIAANNQLRAEKANLESVLTAAQASKLEALAKLETALAAADKELKDTREQLAAASKNLEASVATLKVEQQNLSLARDENKKLSDDVRAQQKIADDSFKAFVAATDELSRLKVKLPQLEERTQQLAADTAKAKLLLAQVGRTLEDPLHAEPPPVTGEVTEINRDGLVQISVGFDDGIRAGHELDVYRGNTFIGRIRITDAEYGRGDVAIGSVMKDYQRQQIRRGDSVTSRLKILARQP